MAPKKKTYKLLHLVSQIGQPYGSRKYCCNYCGLAISGMEEDSGIVDDKRMYRRQTDDGITYIPCRDGKRFGLYPEE